jgi:hypothetical protein
MVDEVDEYLNDWSYSMGLEKGDEEYIDDDDDEYIDDEEEEENVTESKLNKLFDLGIMDMEFDVEGDCSPNSKEFTNLTIEGLNVMKVVGTVEDDILDLQIELSDNTIVSFNAKFDIAPMSRPKRTFVTITHSDESGKEIKSCKFTTDDYLDLLGDYSDSLYMILIKTLFYPGKKLSNKGKDMAVKIDVDSLLTN